MLIFHFIFQSFIWCKFKVNFVNSTGNSYDFGLRQISSAVFAVKRAFLFVLTHQLNFADP